MNWPDAVLFFTFVDVTVGDYFPQLMDDV